MRRLIYILLIIHYSLLIVNAQQPTQEWVRRYTDTTAQNWNSTRIKTDGQGNIYILAQTGLDFGYIKYNSNGILLRVATHWPGGYSSGQGAFFDVTANGEVYITGELHTGFDKWVYTVKYNPNGIFQWGKIYSPPSTNSYSGGLKVDNDGNIIIAGGLIYNNILNMLTIKFNSDGDTIWVRTFNDGTNQGGANAVTVDTFGNIYVTGFTGLPTKCTTLKYNSNGQLLNYYNFSLSSAISYFGYGLTLDLNNNLYVIGAYNVLGSGNNNFLFKLNINLNLQWYKIFTGIVSGQGRNDGVPIGPKVSSDGNSIYYLSRSSNGTGGGGYSIVTLKYNSVGDSQWVKIFNGGGVAGMANSPSSIKLDLNNNIYACGTGYYSATKYDFAAIKYTPIGTQEWSATYSGEIQNANDYANDIFIDTALNVYLTGFGPNLYTGYDAVLIKYSQPNAITNNQEIALDYSIAQNYPNPFNNTTIIKYSIFHKTHLNIILYNVLGQYVKTLINTEKGAGDYSIIISMDDIPTGVYFYQLISDGIIIDTKKMILMK